jgi:hypothetical protein
MPSRRFFNPHNVQHGAVAVTTVQSITLNKTKQRITARGDNDRSNSFQATTGLDVSGTLVIQDPIQADALLDAAAATLSWDGATEEGGAIKTQTVTGVEFFSLNETDSHGAVDGITLGWGAFDASGDDPASVALAP